MATATSSSTVRPTRAQEAYWASQFSRTQNSARTQRNTERNPTRGRANARRVPTTGGYTSPVPALAASSEAERTASWQQARHAEQLATRIPELPQEVQSLVEETPSLQNEEGFQEAQETYGAEYRAATQTALRNPTAGLAQLNQARQRLAQRIEQMEKVIKMAKQARDWIWRIFGRGSPVEVEGAAGWSWLSSGSGTSLYQTLKTIIMPDATLRAALGKSKGMDDGQFLKGFLSFLEPNVLDPKNPIVLMLDYPFAILLILVLWQLFIWVNIAFAIIGAFALIVYGFASALGEFGSFIASFLGY